MKQHIKLIPLLLIISAYMLFTIFGTISHEFGHIAVAKYLGYDTKLHYASMNYNNPTLDEQLRKSYLKHSDLAENDMQSNELKAIQNKMNSDRLFILAGGPTQTIFVGTLGLLILFINRKRILTNGLKPFDWLFVFLALFWLREAFNLFVSLGSEIISPNGTYFNGDEKKIASILNLWDGTISVSLGVVGTLVFLYVLLFIIPKQLRTTFIVGSFIGGVLGFVTWMNFLGPIVLP